MRILFDQGTPQPLRIHLSGHAVEFVRDLGWSQLHNGDLLNEAERSGFHVFVTTDQSLQYQQRLTGRKLAIVVLLSTSWPRMQPHLARIEQAITSVLPGQYVEVPI